MAIPVSDQLAAVIGGRQFRMQTRVTITRGAKILARDLPVDAGVEEQDATLRVPERISLQLPKRINGVDWATDGVESPIAPYGQRVHVKIGVQVGVDGWEWINRGEFLIHDSTLSGPTVTINAVGLLALIDEAGLVTPYNPVGQTLFKSIRKLVEPALTVRKSPLLVDRAVSSTFVYDQDRLGAVESLLAAWPARAQMSPGGYLDVLPADELGNGDPAGTGAGYLNRFHDPDNTFLRPNVTDVSISATRDGIANALVVRGQTSAGLPVQAVAYDRSSGPSQYGGPFNPLPVPEYQQLSAVSLLGTVRLAAYVGLQKRIAPYRRSWKVQAVPNPTYLVNDRIIYLDELRPDGTGVFTRLESLKLPYTSTSGPMECVIRELQP